MAGLILQIDIGVTCTNKNSSEEKKKNISQENVFTHVFLKPNVSIEHGFFFICDVRVRQKHIFRGLDETSQEFVFVRLMVKQNKRISN